MAEMIATAAAGGDDENRQEFAIMEDTKRAIKYDQYLPESSLINGVKTGNLIRGNLAISPYNPLEASIFGSRGETILIQGRLNLNRAIHGDQVVVQLLPQSQWINKGEEVIVADETVEKIDETVESSTTAINMDDDDDNETGKNISMEIDKNGDSSTATTTTTIVPTAKVVGVLKRNWRQFYCGSLDPKSLRDESGWQFVLFNPLDKRIPKIRLRTRQAKELESSRILVAIDSWNFDSRYPNGHFVRRLAGATGDRNTEVDAILLEHEVPFEPFTSNVLACLPSSDWKAHENGK